MCIQHIRAEYWKNVRNNGGKVIKGWRKLHYEELYKLYIAPGIGTVTEWRRIRCTGHVACIRMNTKFRRKTQRKDTAWTTKLSLRRNIYLFVKRSFCPGIHTVSKNLVATSKFQAPELWHETISVLDATVQNLFATATWRLVFVHFDVCVSVHR